MKRSPLESGFRRFAMLGILAVAGRHESAAAGGQEVTPEAIDQARQLWTKAGIRDYDLEWTVAGAQSNHYYVTVRGGEVRKVEAVRPDGQRIAAQARRHAVLQRGWPVSHDRRRAGPAQDRSSLWPARGDQGRDAVQARPQAGLSAHGIAAT